MYLRLQEIKLFLFRDPLLGFLCQKEASSKVIIQIRLLLSCYAFVSEGLKKNLFIAACLYSSLNINIFVCTRRFLLNLCYLFCFFFFNIIQKHQKSFHISTENTFSLNCGIFNAAVECTYTLFNQPIMVDSFIGSIIFPLFCEKGCSEYPWKVEKILWHSLPVYP